MNQKMPFGILRYKHTFKIRKIFILFYSQKAYTGEFSKPDDSENYSRHMTERTWIWKELDDLDSWKNLDQTS